MNSNPSISVVIPVYNGEKTIGLLVDGLIAQWTLSARLEVVLVNDCSTDGSEQVCVSLFKKYPRIVKFYSLAKNFGEHNAVMAGLNQVKSDYVVIMDDDFQNPISEVIKLISFGAAQNYDVVYTYYEKKQHSVFRNFGSWFNDRVANIILKKPKHLYLSSFKLLNRFVVNEIIKYDLPFPYIDGLILFTTRNIGKIQVEHHPRRAGKSGYTLVKLFRAWANMFVSFSILPLRVATILGLIFSLAGLGLGVWMVIEKLTNPNLPVGYAALMVVVAIFAGVQLTALGMIGEYIGRIFLSQKRRPQFVIRNRYEESLGE